MHNNHLRKFHVASRRAQRTKFRNSGWDPRNLDAQHTSDPDRVSEPTNKPQREGSRDNGPCIQSQKQLRDPAPNNPPDFSPLEYCNSVHGIYSAKRAISGYVFIIHPVLYGERLCFIGLCFNFRNEGRKRATNVCTA